MSSSVSILEGYDWVRRKLVGQGAFCNVFKVKSKNKNEYVAIKEIDMKIVDGIQDQIKNEIIILKKINHKNVIQLLDSYIGDDKSYEILQYCEMNLRTLLQQNNGRLPQSQAIQLLTQIIEGMKELRNNNYVHRDLKPENLLLLNGVVKICDFGLTVYSKDGSRLIRFCGTPFYMSPQIVFKKYYTSKTDIWSLGVMFYEMLFGYTPWACRDEMSYKINIKQNSLKFPFDTPIGILSKDFICKCLEIEEQKRMGWPQVFQHPLIKKHATTELTHRYLIDKQAQPILKHLQLCYYKDAKSVQSVFIHNSYENLMNMVDFYQSYRCFYPLTVKQSRALFQQADLDNDGKVSEEELIKILNCYDFEDGKDIPSKIIRDIRQIILNNNINIDSLFRKADLNHNGTLDLMQLQTLIKLVAQSIYSFDIKQVFSKIDLDKDGKISRHEVEVMLGGNQFVRSEKGFAANNELMQAENKRLSASSTPFKGKNTTGMGSDQKLLDKTAGYKLANPPSNFKIKQLSSQKDLIRNAENQNHSAKKMHEPRAYNSKLQALLAQRKQ